MKRFIASLCIIIFISVFSNSYAAAQSLPEAQDVFLNNADCFDGNVCNQTHATMVIEAELYSESEDMIRGYINELEMFHQRGLKYTVWTSMFDYQGNDYSNHPEYQNAVCINIDGNKIKWDLMGGYYQCINQKAWRDGIINRAKTEIKLGVDGISFDECNSNYAVLEESDGCFCSACMQGFRDYLASKYSTSQLKKLGISNINTFDYAQYLKKKGLVEEYKTQNRDKVPFYHDFEAFQLKSVNDFYKSTAKELKDYAKSLGKDLMISGNTASLRPNLLFMTDQFDYLSPEIDFDLPRDFRGAAYYKLGQSLNKPLYVCPNCAYDTELMTRSDMTNIMKLYTAEAYAYGGWLNVPYGSTFFDRKQPAGPQGYPYKIVNADIGELANYYDFITTQDIIYQGTESVADTAIIYSFASQFNSSTRGEADDNFYGICNYFTNSNIPYNIIFAGDDKLINDRLISKNVSKYKTIILPDTACLSRNQLDILLQFVESGGKVIAFGDVGSYLPDGEKLSSKTLKTLNKVGKNKYGKGTWIYMKDQIGGIYRNSQKISSSDQAVFQNISYNTIKTSADKNVVINRVYQPKEDFEILHILNYNYDDKKKAMIPYKNTQISMKVNRKLLGKELGVYAVTPDSEGIQEIKATVVKDSISFALPQLNYYSVVVVCERDKFMANQLMNSLADQKNKNPLISSEELSNLSAKAAEEYSGHNYKEAVRDAQTAWDCYNMLNTSKMQQLTGIKIDGDVSDWSQIKSAVDWDVSKAFSTGIDDFKLTKDDRNLYMTFSYKRDISDTSIWFDISRSWNKDYYVMFSDRTDMLQAQLYKNDIFVGDINTVAVDNKVELSIPLESIGYQGRLTLRLGVIPEGEESLFTDWLEVH